jgi:prepilin-type N-terminal cleavage/methylation domain-containing protein
MKGTERRGFTLVELLVVIAIIGILVALLLPAIQAAREAARRTQCNNNLKNIAVGLQNYHDSYKTLPYGAIHAGRVAAQTRKMGPCWQVAIMPFLEQRNIYDRLMATQRQGAPGYEFIAGQMNQPDATNGDLARLIPDYMRCPSSPTPKMATQTGTVCLPSYVGIAGGTDINPADTTLYPNQRWGQPSPGRVYVNRAAAMFDVGTAQGVVFTNSGMLPLAERKAFQACRDGLSNTMIVSEQSDWLEDVDVNFSSKYHGDPGWGGVTNTDTAGGGFVSGCRENLRIPQGLYTATTYTPSGPIFNITTVRYKPDLKRVLGATPVPGCGEICGLNNPLQSPHPGGVLTAFVDCSVQFIAATTDLRVLLQLAIASDGQKVKLQ